jgi:hypothetical protein
MSSDARKLRFSQIIPRRLPSLRVNPNTPLALDCYLPLVQTLFELREQQASGVVIAFTAVARGEGVTHVVESLGRKLAEHTWEQVLLTTAADLTSAASARFDEGSEPVPQVQRLIKPRRVPSYLPTSPWDGLQRLRDRFGFVLVDCPAMRTAIRNSPAILDVLSNCDGAVLVVASGEARRNEVENARKMLNTASVKLLGSVLNKQEDPVPRFISRLF